LSAALQANKKNDGLVIV